jgi:signal transduction histidine kinase
MPNDGAPRPEVSCRVAPVLLDEAERLGRRRADVLAEAGVVADRVARRLGWLTFAEYAAIAEAVRPLQGQDGWVDFGGRSLQMPMVRMFGLAAGSLTGQRAVYAWLCRAAAGPDGLIYRAFALSFEAESGGDEAQIVMRALRDVALPDVLVWSAVGGFAAIPRLVGVAPAEVRVEVLEDGCACFSLVLSKERAPFWRAGTWLGAQRPDQRSELREAYDELRAKNGELRGRMEELIRMQEDRLLLDARLAEQARAEMLGRVAGGVAHDFNNLLTVLVARADMLGLSMPPGPELAAARRHLESVLRTAERAASLTDQLVAVGRQQRLHLESVDLAAHLERSRPLLTDVLGDRLLVLERPAEPLWVRVDVAQIDRVITNLLANSRDAVGPGEPVILRLCRDGEQALVEVEDRGVGMRPETVERAFEPYFTTKARASGVGLGLPAVRGLVQQHGGRVEISSQAGLGTTVRAVLPLASPKSDVQPSILEAAIPATPGVKILVVDDDEVVLDVAVAWLSALGYAVRPARDLEAAVALARSIDVLLTDVVMPGTDGVALAQAVRGVRPGLPVVFMSGYAAAELDGLASLPERAAFLRKPFTQLTLVEAIESVLDPRGFSASH